MLKQSLLQSSTHTQTNKHMHMQKAVAVTRFPQVMINMYLSNITEASHGHKGFGANYHQNH